MSFLLLSIVCSVALSVLLKIARGFSIGLEKAVAINYWVAAFLCWLFLQPDFPDVRHLLSHAWLFVLLGFLLPLVFIWMGCAVDVAGIVKADAAQRLSLFIGVFSAFVFFGEALNWVRLTALFLAFIALICLMMKPDKGVSSRSTVWLFGVWLGYGVIDVLLKMLSKTGNMDVHLLILFVISGILMSVFLVYKNASFQWRDGLFGVFLGCLNFCTICSYLQAHRVFAQKPSVVFAGMNIGVMVFGTLVGMMIFGEKINKINMVGVFLALFSFYALSF